jgi:hypothetical protein
MIRRSGSIALLALAVIAAPQVSRAQEVAISPATSLDWSAIAAATATLDSVKPLVTADTPQLTTPDSTTQVATSEPATPQVAGPTLDGATAGFHRTAQVARGPVTVAAARANNSTALMIVGGAAFLAGAIISGDAGTIIMVGGAAVGLYGLYLYLQ